MRRGVYALWLFCAALSACGKTAQPTSPATTEPDPTNGGANAAGGANATGGTSQEPTLDCNGPHPGPKPLTRLDGYQLQRSLRALLPGFELPSLIPSPFDSSYAPGDFGVAQADAWHRVAHDAARYVSGDAKRLSAFSGCAETEQGDPACSQRFITAFAELAFRHLPSDAERGELSAVFEDGVKLGDGFAGGVRAVVEVVLQSPEFLYLIERGSGRVEGAAVALSGDESAARLAYFLTGAAPDNELRAMASLGELSAAALAQQARRLLGTPANREQTRRFYARRLRLDDLSAAAPEFDAELVELAREQSARFVEDVTYDGAGTFRALLTEPSTWVNERLAGFYGFPGVTGDAFQKLPLDPAEHAGLFTQAAFLARNAGPSSSNPVQRGQSLLQELLCWSSAPPPPEVPFPLVEVPPEATTRERFTRATADASCQECHRTMNPVGFAFEHYDQFGRFRDAEKGQPIDASGELLVSDAAGPFEDAVGLLSRLAESPDAQACFTSHWLELALARPTSKEDACAAASALDAFQASDGSLTELLVALAQTDVFRYRLGSEL